MIVNWGELLAVVLSLVIIWLWAYHSPRQIIRLGCWLVSWGEARAKMKRQQFSRYAQMLAEREQPRPSNFEKQMFS